MSKIKPGDTLFMRFVVRPNMNGIFGFNHGLFKEGVVYEIKEMGGEYVVREIGPSPLTLEVPIEQGFCNERSYDCLIREFGSQLVMSIDEVLSWTKERLK